MTENFLPIPYATNYEVNSKFVVRNIKTKHVCKPDKYGWVHIYIDGKLTSRSAQKARRVAVAARNDNQNSTWTTIPSAPNYEINNRGVVRHKATKTSPKLYDGNRYELSLGKKKSRAKRSVNSLLHEVFGIVPTTVQTRRPCTVSRNGAIYHFDTLTDAAKFLAKTEFFSVKYIRRKFTERVNELFGWKITYLFDVDSGA